MNQKVMSTYALGIQLGDVVYERCIKLKSQDDCSNMLYSWFLHPSLILETILTSVNSKTSIGLKYSMVQ